MDLNLLNNIKMNERRYHHLSSVPETFYEDLHQSLSSLKDGVAGGESEMYEYTNFCIICSEIIERRLNKIMNNAYMYSIRKYNLTTTCEVEVDVPLNAVRVEVSFFYGLLHDFKRFYCEVGLD